MNESPPQARLTSLAAGSPRLEPSDRIRADRSPRPIASTVHRVACWGAGAHPRRLGNDESEKPPSPIRRWSVLACVGRSSRPYRFRRRRDSEATTRRCCARPARLAISVRRSSRSCGLRGAPEHDADRNHPGDERDEPDEVNQLEYFRHGPQQGEPSAEDGRGDAQPPDPRRGYPGAQMPREKSSMPTPPARTPPITSPTRKPNMSQVSPTASSVLLASPVASA